LVQVFGFRRLMDRLLLETSANPSSQWAVIALGVLTVVYVAVIRPMRKGKRKDPLGRSPAQLSLAQQRVVEREMTNLLVEYEEMLRRMSAQLDTRAAKLEILMKEADEKLQRLEKLVRTPDPAAARDAGMAQASAATPTQEVATIAADSAVPEGTVEAIEAGGNAPPAGSDRRHADVYDLADRGQTPQQIAQQINRPAGEVELILALRSAGRP
jgi:hypothetical protein